MSGEIRLDARLLAVCDYVRPGSVVADVGADHGRLICHLVKSGLAIRGFACEANLQPLNRASAFIRENCLSRDIDTVFTNGLNDLPYQLIDTFVIAGMGGDLIAQILLKHHWTRDNRFHFILQPMTKAENLRGALFKNGFVIGSETAVISDNKVYTVMSVRYTDRTIAYTDINCYTGCLPLCASFPARLYLEKTAARLEKKAQGLAFSKNPGESAKYAALSEEIRRIAKEMQINDLSN